MINHHKHTPIYLALFLAFITCCRVLWIQHGWITNDSILYFEMARHFAMGDPHPFEGYSWGFYPALIACLHTISGLGLQASANLLIVVFFMLLVWGLMRMVSIAGGNDWTQFYAVVLLLSSGYIVGDILPMASRDLGYWAMMVHAVNQLILFYQQGRWQQALYWQMFALLATLFRIEGAIQWLVLPLAGFFISHPASSRLKRLVAPYSLLFVGSLIAPVVSLAMHMTLEDLGRVKELFTGFRDIEMNFTRDITHRVDNMRDTVIGEPFQEYAWFSFLLVYFAITTLKCLSVAGWGPILLAYAEKHSIKKSMQPAAYQVLLFWLFVSWVIGCLITFKVNLLSARYVALFGFVLIVFASFALHKLMHHQKATMPLLKKLLIVVIALILLAGFISNIKAKDAGFYYEIDAVAYVKSRLPAGQQALYSSAKQRFYADVPYDSREDYAWDDLAERIADGRMQQYSYIVVKFDDTPEEHTKLKAFQQQLVGFQLDKTFYGHKQKKQLLVFKRVG
ncbi:MAG TPA: hypothetical protein VK958_04600 [Methylophilus sp.]|uniref:hypothetical protein n=1 Tax=Methylophilus sp. TaxID=29541 RepID=UPI002C6C1E27|nr:hypothetical protein [Methylophilus sp.]HSH86515.1 hypothetical protein [Methylophilus sp.]